MNTVRKKPSSTQRAKCRKENLWNGVMQKRSLELKMIFRCQTQKEYYDPAGVGKPSTVSWRQQSRSGISSKRLKLPAGGLRHKVAVSMKWMVGIIRNLG